MNLTNKNVFITGGGTGIGKALAKLLVEKQCRVVICGRNQDVLQQTQSEIGSGNLLIETCDISDYGQVERMAKKYPETDAVINNAGVWLEGELEKNNVSDIYKTIMINLGGLIYTTHAFLPFMKQRDQGVVVNVSSSVGLQARENIAVYSATKFGVRGFTEALKKELSSTNIEVIGFYPCGTKTELYNKANQPRTSNLFETYIEPQEMAEVLLFALERSDHLTLDHIVVNRKKKPVTS